MSEKLGDTTRIPAPRASAGYPPLTTEPVTLLTPKRAIGALHAAVADELRGRQRLWALEAGAGKRCRIDLPEDAYVVGVDRDADAIARNARLDERVLTDLADYVPRATGFDLITCWYVLEHVDNPGILLNRFAEWTAPGGLIVLAVPNLRSPKSLVTKLTPHRWHIWFRRRMIGLAQAGQPGHGPYPTTLRRAITPASMIRRLALHGFRPVFHVYFEDAKQTEFRHRVGVTGRRWKAVRALVRIVSFGQLDAARTEYAVVFRRDG